MTLFIGHAATLDGYLLDLCQEDRDEMDLIPGQGTYQDRVLASMEASPGICYSAWDRQALLAIGGVSKTQAGYHPWLLHAEGLKRHRKAALREAKVFVEQLRKVPGPVCNVVSKKATRARAFITHLGFVIEPREGPFDYFYLPKTHV